MALSSVYVSGVGPHLKTGFEQAPALVVKQTPPRDDTAEATTAHAGHF